MALTKYQQQTQLLMNDVAQAKYNIFDLTNYINSARGQIAASTGCCRLFSTMQTTANIRQVLFSALTLPTGAAGVLNIRQITLNGTNGGMSKMENRPFEWFLSYRMAVPTAATGTPNCWAQYALGTQGSLFFDPIPSAALTINVDAVLQPSDLATDSDAELLPYPWTDCVSFYAAYLAYLNAQSPQMAGEMYKLFQLYAKNSMSQSNPTVLPENFLGHSGAAGAATAMPVTGMIGVSPSGGQGQGQGG